MSSSSAADPIDQFVERCHSTASRWNGMELRGTEIKPCHLLGRYWSCADLPTQDTSNWRMRIFMAFNMVVAAVVSVVAFPAGLIMWPLFIAPGLLITRGIENTLREIEHNSGILEEALPAL